MAIGARHDETDVFYFRLGFALVVASAGMRGMAP